MNKKTKGFTLIELLVVIAIIGILSSVVLASLNSARNKGANAAAKSNLNNARAQAELFYDTKGDYDTVCTATGGISANVTAADGAVTGTATCVDLAAAWAAEVTLNNSEGFYCVDSRGSATTSATTFSLSDGSTTTAACI
jgi:type IV pilus assembly protein PilE